MKKLFTLILLFGYLFIQAQPVIENGVLKSWDGASGDIIIPAEVTSIDPSVFLGNTDIISVSGANVTSIGANAFENCSNVTSYDFPNLVDLGKRAFRGNSKLQSIDISKVTSINEAFHSCRALITVTAPLLTTIGNYSFYNCSALASVSFPEVQIVGIGAFQGCSQLTIVSMNKVTSIGQDAFRSSKLTSLSFPSLTTLGKSAFQGVTTLTSLAAPNLEIVGESSFHTTGLQTVNFPKVKSIGNYGFFNNISLTEATFPSLETIGLGAFSAQSALQASMTLTKVFLNEATNLSSVAADAFIKTMDGLTIYVNSEAKVSLFPPTTERSYKVVVDPSTGIQSKTSDKLSVVYQDGTSDIIHITVSDDMLGAELNLMDINGRLVYKKQINNKLEVISLDFLNNGIYLVRINDFAKKIIIR